MLYCLAALRWRRRRRRSSSPGWKLVEPVLLLALLLLMLPLSWNQVVATPMPQGEDAAASGNVSVCVMPYSVFSVCGTNGTTDFTGFEPELFEEVADYLYQRGSPEWGPGQWSFRCFIDSSELYSSIAAALQDGTCTVAMGGINTDEVASLPVKLTYSTFHTGRRILTFSYTPDPLWAFLLPLSEGVWLLWLGSSVAVALLLLALEAPWAQTGACTGGSGGSRRGVMQGLADGWRRYCDFQWGVTGLALRGVFHLYPRTPGSRLAVLGLAFTSMLLACMYAAALSAANTVQSLRPPVDSLASLRKLRVGIWEGDADIFSAFALDDVHLLQWNTDADGEAMIAQLQQRRYNALVLDDLYVEYMASTHCDLSAMGPMLTPTNMGFMFADSISDAYLQNFDIALQSLWDQGTVDELIDQFVRVPKSCPDQLPENWYLQVSLQEVGGLWIILAACIGAGAVLNVLAAGSTSCGRALYRCGVWACRCAVRARRSCCRRDATVDAEACGDDECAGVVGDEWAGWSEGEPETRRQAPPAASFSETLQQLHARLDQLDRSMDELPGLVTALIDQEFTPLSMELVCIITKHLSRGPGHRGSMSGARSRHESASGARSRHESASGARSRQESASGARVRPEAVPAPGTQVQQESTPGARSRHESASGAKPPRESLPGAAAFADAFVAEVKAHQEGGSYGPACERQSAPAAGSPREIEPAPGAQRASAPAALAAAAAAAAAVAGGSTPAAGPAGGRSSAEARRSDGEPRVRHRDSAPGQISQLEPEEPGPAASPSPCLSRAELLTLPRALSSSSGSASACPGSRPRPHQRLSEAGSAAVVGHAS